jgi:hypothetical protein
LAAAAILALILAGWSSTSRACTVPCRETASVTGETGPVPANVTGVYWQGVLGGGYGHPPTARMWRADDGRPVNVTLEYLERATSLIRIEEPLEASVIYEIEVDASCGEGTTILSIETASEAPAPSSSRLGALRAATPHHDRLLVEDDSSCSGQVAAVYVDVQIEWDSADAAWWNAVALQTLVDGQPWRPRHFVGADVPVSESWVGRGADRILAVCEPDVFVNHKVPEGTHVVEMVATLPGSTHVWRSDPVEIHLECPVPQEPAAEVTYRGGGCAAVGAPPASSISPLLAAFTIFFLRRRRHQNASTSSGTNTRAP